MTQGIKACVFDAYGTLFDVHSAMGRHAAAIGPGAAELSRQWRLRQIEYTWTRSLMGRHADFWEVTGEALDVVMRGAGLADPSLRDRLMKAYLTLDAYPEVPDVLRRLKDARIRCAILSNGTPKMLDAAVRSAGLENLIESNISVEQVGIYKPDPRVYQSAVDRLGVAPGEISFQSSNVWDAAGAAAFGFRVVWVNRFRQPREYGWVLSGEEIASLEPLLGLVS